MNSLITKHVPNFHPGKMRSKNNVSIAQEPSIFLPHGEDEFLSLKTLLINSDTSQTVFPTPTPSNVASSCLNPLPASSRSLLRKQSGSGSSSPPTSTNIDNFVYTSAHTKAGCDDPVPNIPGWLDGTVSSPELVVSDSSSDSDSEDKGGISVTSSVQQVTSSETTAIRCIVPPWLLENEFEADSDSDKTDSVFEDKEELAGYISSRFWPIMNKKSGDVKLGEVMDEEEGVGVEYWEVDELSKLCPTTLAVLLCGMLNSGSGVVWAGVGKDGIVRGCEMGRAQRDKIRQMLDKVCSNNITPRVGPRVVDIDFVRVEGAKELWLIKYTVRLNEEVLYRVQNIDRTRFNEGVYVRNNTGPEFTEFVSEEVLKIILNADQ